MLTNRELLLGIFLPLAIALLFGAVAWWRRLPGLAPLAVGLGFLAGYASSLGATGGFGLPHLPPADGTDWLFWTTLPAMLLGIITARLGWRWLTVLATCAGLAVWAILHPLVPGSLSNIAILGLALAAGLLGVILATVLSFAADRIGHTWVTLALSVIVGGTGVVVLASNLRTTGVYGLGAGAAIFALAPFARSLRATGGLAILAVSILLGLLTCGRFYPDPGVSLLGLVILLAAPLLTLAGFVVPGKRPWLRGLTSLLAVTLAVAAIAVPTALAAKQAAEADPYSSGK